MVRLSGHAGNSGDVARDAACCIASGCMMWRRVNTAQMADGYCGLAGVPTQRLG